MHIFKTLEKAFKLGKRQFGILKLQIWHSMSTQKCLILEPLRDQIGILSTLRRSKAKIT